MSASSKRYRMHFVILGGYGIIGSSVARDLFRTSRDCRITIAGRDTAKTHSFARSFASKRVVGRSVDISDTEELTRCLKAADVVINCVQYSLNISVMRVCIRAKTNYVDLGGMFHTTKKQLKLDGAFKRIKRTAIIGIGAAPGISNLLAAYGSRSLKKVTVIDIAFAGSDHTESPPFVLPYSFKTLVDEYTEQPAVFRNGKIIYVTPRSGRKKYDFGRFGRQEGFLVLHSEIATLPAFFRHKGIRTVEFRATFSRYFSKTIETLIDLGFTSVPVVDITTRIMDRLVPPKKIKDRELIRVTLNTGTVTMDAITASDGKTPAGILDTAVPCSIAAQFIARGDIRSFGVLSPERAIAPIPFFEELRKRDIEVYRNGRPIN